MMTNVIFYSLCFMTGCLLTLVSFVFSLFIGKDESMGDACGRIRSYLLWPMTTAIFFLAFGTVGLATRAFLGLTGFKGFFLAIVCASALCILMRRLVEAGASTEDRSSGPSQVK